MSDAPFKYKRLPGRGRRRKFAILVAAARCGLWLGPDHLLSVDTIWMNEAYKRFYFRDIQSISVQRTNSSSAWSWILGTLTVCSAALFGALAFNANTADSKHTLYIVGAIFTFLFLLFTVINLLRGPSCICKLRTAVQMEVLPSLSRVRTANKAIAILKPLIEQTQGQFSPEDMSRPIPPAPPAARIGGYISADATPPRPRLPGTGVLHAVLYGIMIEDCALGLYECFHPIKYNFMSTIGNLQMLAMLVLSIVAVVRQKDHPVAKWLHRVTIVNLVENPLLLVATFGFAFFYQFTYTMQHPGKLPNSGVPSSYHGYQTFMIATNVLEGITGIAGAALTAAWMLRRKAGEPAAPESPQAPPN